MLVVIEGNKSARALHDRDDLVKELFARVQVLPQFIFRIVAMLADGEHPIDSQFLPTQAERRVNCFVDRDLVIGRHLPGHVAVRHLVGIKTDHLHPRISHLTVEQVGLKKILEQHMGMRPISELGKNRGHFGTPGRGSAQAP
jgi:hypothetical protein